MNSADSFNSGGRLSCLFLRDMSQCQFFVVEVQENISPLWHKARNSNLIQGNGCNLERQKSPLSLKKKLFFTE